MDELPLKPEPLEGWGPFRLLDQVGEGGFGVVYRALDPKLDREVAVKLLKVTTGGDSGYASIIAEARRMAKVKHSNIVQVHGVDIFDGRVGFWSDFVNGKTLDTLLAIQGPFSAQEAVFIGIEVCRALGAVHGAGLLHRDVKASNVMREQGGRIVLMDFGLSSEVHQTELPGGTPACMAPELFHGQPASVASDIYALGVLLYYLCSAKYPPGSKGVGVRRTLMDERPDLPEAFAAALSTATHQNPAERFQSAGEMATALAASLGTTVPVLLPKATPSSRRIPLRWWHGALAAALLVGGVLYSSGVPNGHLTGHASTASDDYLRQAESYLEREDRPEDIAKAVDLFRKAVVAEPTSALPHCGLAQAYLASYRAGRNSDLLQSAVAEARKAIKLNSELAGPHITMGLVYTTTSQYDKAKEELNKAVALDATDAEAYAARGRLFAVQHREGEAIEAFQRAVALGVGDSRWNNQFGLYYLSLGKYEASADCFSAVLAIQPDNVYGLVNLGITFSRRDRLTDAESTFRKALRLDPDSSLALSNLASLLLRLGRNAEAVEMYERAVSRSPGDYRLRANLASAYQRTPDGGGKANKEYLKAIELALELRKAQPKDPGITVNLGNYYASVGDRAKALPLLAQAGELAPGDPNIMAHVGSGLERIGHRPEAIRAICQALKFGYSKQYLASDPELTSLLRDPHFVAACPGMR